MQILFRLNLYQSVFKLRMLKQVVAAFEINSCLVFCCTRFNCNDIHYYSTKTERVTHGVVGASAGAPNKFRV